MELLSTGTSFDVSLRFLAGVGAGVVATLVMDVVMGRLPEGTTPPSIAAGVLTQHTPRTAPGRIPGIRRDWAISAAVYLVALVPVVTFVSGLL